MSSPAEQTSAPAVDPTQHRPVDCCEYCDDVTQCPGWMRDRMRQQYRVEGWEDGAWTMMSGAEPYSSVREADLRMQQLKARFPEMPMRVVAETTSFHVVSTAPAQTSPSKGDQVT
jgi:hypothetical protein